MPRIALLGGVLLTLVAACGDDSGGSGGAGSSSSSNAPTATGGPTPTGWIADACGVCFSQACKPLVDACNGDPGCASTLACLEACPADPGDGPAQVACAAACTVPDSSTALAAYQALDACRTSGDGFNACPTCQPEIEEPLCEPADPPSNCTACLESECCEWIGKYRKNPEAQAISTCFAACPDVDYEGCFLECAAAHESGVADWGATFGCSGLHCLGEEKCGNAGVAIDPCEQCTADNCAESSFACDSQPACLLYSYCFTACDGDVDCSRDCDDAYPGGKAPFDTIAACLLSDCEGVCGD